VLRHTFCHAPGVGIRSEARLWATNIHTWDDLLALETRPSCLKPKAYKDLREYLEASIHALEVNEPQFFTEHLPKEQHWRCFEEYRTTTAFLDIETNGGVRGEEYITTIAVYDGQRTYTYVYGLNLNAFVRDIQRYSVIVTFNGKSFDIPKIRRYLGVDLDHCHIDLRYVFARLGFKGGLKRIEELFGIDREELDGIDGWFAVKLWQAYLKDRNEKALETLLAYNMLDVVNLEKLMIIAHNMLTQSIGTIWARSLPEPLLPSLPLEPDLALIKKLKRSTGYF